MPLWRRVILIIVVVFIIYAVINDPTNSADVTSNAWGHIKDAISAIGTFFDDLINH
jgi:hypothetical protein